MVPFDNFLPDLYADAEGVPEPLALSRLRDATVLFCRRSDWLRQYVTQAVTGGTAVYTLAATNSDERPVSMGNVICRNATTGDDIILVRRDYNEIAQEFTSDDQVGQPELIVRESEARNAWRVRLYPKPPTTFTGYSLIVELILAPTRTATQLDDELYEEWKEAILAGTLASLYKMPNKHWSNPTQVALQLQMFDRLVRDARIRRDKGRSHREGPVTYRPASSLRGGGYFSRGGRAVER